MVKGSNFNRNKTKYNKTINKNRLINPLKTLSMNQSKFSKVPERTLSSLMTRAISNLHQSIQNYSKAQPSKRETQKLHPSHQMIQSHLKNPLSLLILRKFSKELKLWLKSSTGNASRPTLAFAKVKMLSSSAAWTLTPFTFLPISCPHSTTRQIVVLIGVTNVRSSMILAEISQDRTVWEWSRGFTRTKSCFVVRKNLTNSR